MSSAAVPYALLITFAAFTTCGVRAMQYTTRLLYIGPYLMRPPREETTWPAH